MTNHHIFIDGSYYVFFRLFALANWWKLSHPDETSNDFHLNDEFINHFREIFVIKLREIPKKLKISLQKNETVHFYIGKDCSQETIWRKKFRPSCI